MVLSVYDRNVEMYDCCGWVRVRHTLFSRRKSWYMRLLGSTLTLHDHMHTPGELEFSVISCKLSYSFLPRAFTIKLLSGDSLRVSFHTKDDEMQWIRALKRASVLKFTDQFETYETVQKMETCSIFKAIDKEYKSEHFVHQFVRDPLTPTEDGDKAMHRRIYALLNLKHPNILWASDVFNEEKHVSFITNPVKTRPLESLITENGDACFSEAEAQAFARQLASVLHYMHGRGYVHRDVTPQNMLVDCDDAEKHKLLLSNFENVAFVDDEEDLRMRGEVGDERYCAPEMISGKFYNAAVDMYALGVCIYRMLCGSFPFEVNSSRKLLTIRARQIGPKFEEDRWKEISEEAKMFVQSLLEPLWTNRLTSKAACGHPWILKKIPETGRRMKMEVQQASTKGGKHVDCKPVSEVSAKHSKVKLNDVEALLKQDRHKLSPFMQRFLSPFSSEPSPSVISPVDAYAKIVQQYGGDGKAEEAARREEKTTPKSSPGNGVS